MNGKCEKIARMFGSILYKKNNADLLTFAETGGQVAGIVPYLQISTASYFFP